MPSIQELEDAHTAAQAAANRAHLYYAFTFERLQNVGRAIRAFGPMGSELEAAQVEYAAAKRGYEAAQEVEDSAWERLLSAQLAADARITARTNDKP